ncbi:MAG: NAD/NADP octopine/nopaline dehydrogenase family protein [Steroidobacteraceae bacterium]
MEIAVLGGGHGCYASVAEFTERGHTVRWWRRDDAQHELIRQAGGLTVRDYRGTRKLPTGLLTADLAEAVCGAQLVVVPLPATVHESLAEPLAKVLQDGQVVFLPPGTFGGFILASALHRHRPGARVRFAETGTLPYLARKHGPAEVVISGYATRLPTGVFPARDATGALQVLGEAYSSIEPCGDLLSAALMNAGPVIHPPLILMNAGPLEHFDAWDIHNEGTQPSIRRTTDALDEERIALRESLGYGSPHFPLRDHYATDGDEWMYGRAAHERLTDSGDWREHIDLCKHRYMLEDVAIGLSFFCSVARWRGVPMRIGEGMLAIGSAIVGRDLYAGGRSLERLGLHRLSREAFQKLMLVGFADG